MTRSTEDYYAATYTDARATFLAACLRAGVNVDSYRNPLKGPEGESLFTDVALVGDPDAEQVVAITSATHGVEGFAGSAIQVGLLLDHSAPKPAVGTALLLVHAINPWGMAWLRRENEDGVDLNRNFVDHEGGNYPENDLFEELVEHLVPAQWNDDAWERYKATLERLNHRYGEVPVRKAMHKGQYRHPDSVHYGGDRASWSSRTLSKICTRYLEHARRAVLIDVHTGLGPYGYGELMTPSKPGEPVYDLFHDWYGDQVHSTTAGSSAYAGSKGSILAGFKPPLEHLAWAAIGLEFGTREREHMRRCMLANTWLHARGELDSDLGRRIKREVKDASYPDETAWKQQVWERGLEVTRTALSRIAT